MSSEISSSSGSNYSSYSSDDSYTSSDSSPPRTPPSKPVQLYLEQAAAADSNAPKLQPRKLVLKNVTKGQESMAAFTLLPETKKARKDPHQSALKISELAKTDLAHETHCPEFLHKIKDHLPRNEYLRLLDVLFRNIRDVMVLDFMKSYLIPEVQLLNNINSMLFQSPSSSTASLEEESTLKEVKGHAKKKRAWSAHLTTFMLTNATTKSTQLHFAPNNALKVLPQEPFKEFIDQLQRPQYLVLISQLFPHIADDKEALNILLCSINDNKMLLDYFKALCATPAAAGRS